MKPKLLILHCCLFFTCVGQINAQPRSVDLTPIQMLADFDMLRNALEESHGGLYRFSGKPEVNKLFNETRKRIEQAGNRQQFIALLSEMLAALRDGHMRLEYDDATV